MYTENISSEDSNSPNKLEKEVNDELHDNFGSLLKSEYRADVKILIKGTNKTISAHTNILGGKNVYIKRISGFIFSNIYSTQ